MKMKIGKLLFCLTFLAIFIVTILTYWPSRNQTTEVSGQQLSVKIISINEFENLLYNKDIVIIDVRDEEEYEQGHIANAINVPLSMIEQQLEQLNITKNSPIILYCQMGKRSLKAAYLLMNNGYTEVYVLKDGMAHYKGELVK